MRRRIELRFIFIFVVLFVFGGIALVAASSENIRWYSYEEGLIRGEAEHKKILLSFYADWCAYCKKMEKETFNNPSIQAYLDENFIAVRINSDKETKLAREFEIRGLPTTWFVTANGEKIGSRPGFVDAREFLPILQYVSTDSYKKMNFSKFMEALND